MPSDTEEIRNDTQVSRHDTLKKLAPDFALTAIIKQILEATHLREDCVVIFRWQRHRWVQCLYLIDISLSLLIIYKREIEKYLLCKLAPSGNTMNGMEENTLKEKTSQQY